MGTTTVAQSNRAAITLAVGLYLVWVLATYLLARLPFVPAWPRTRIRTPRIITLAGTTGA